jgi:hypothetical protein
LLVAANRSISSDCPIGCCQSNRNSSPIGRFHLSQAPVQAMSFSHSANAAERRSL